MSYHLDSKRGVNEEQVWTDGHEPMSTWTLPRHVVLGEWRLKIVC